MERHSPTSNEELVKNYEIKDGFYSGYLKDRKMHGPGTWVSKDKTERY